MSASLIPNEYQLADNIPGEEPGLPREAILDTVPRSALPATKKIVNLVPVSSNSAGPSSTIQFLIPQRNMAQAHSFYLKFRLSVVTDGVGRAFSFSGLQQSVAALFNNISIQAGGIIVESLQNYHLWHNNIMALAAQGNDKLAWESIESGSQLPNTYLGKWASASWGGAAATYDQERAGFYNNTTIDAGAAQLVSDASALRQYVGSLTEVVFTVPIYLGFFNPKESQLIPLQFINGGVLLTIQTNPLTKAFWTDDAAGITSFTMSDMELCYHEVQLPPEYVLRVRNEMTAQRRIRIECQSYQLYQTQDLSSIRQMLNANLASLAGIFWGKVLGIDSQTTPKTFQGWAPDNEQNLRLEVYLDNVLLYQSPNQLNSIAVQARQLQEALTNSINDYSVSPITIGRGGALAGPLTANGTFYGSSMLWGISTKLFASNTTSMDGSPVNTVTLNFTQSSGVNGNNTFYVFLVYDYVYTVLPTGSIDKFM